MSFTLVKPYKNAEGHSVNIMPGKDCWYITDTNNVVIAVRESRQEVEAWLDEYGYKRRLPQV
jgi:hypothetical protein